MQKCALLVLFLLEPAVAAAFCVSPLPSAAWWAPRRVGCDWIHRRVRRAPSSAVCVNAQARDLPAIIMPEGGEGLERGERRVLVFSDKSEKRALKQVMKGGAQGQEGKVGRLLLVQFDAEALANRRLLLAPEGCEVQVVSEPHEQGTHAPRLRILGAADVHAEK